MARVSTVTEFSTQVVSLPLDVNFGGKAGAVSSISYVLVRILSNDGHEGIGFASASRPNDTQALRFKIESLREAVLGQDPLCIERIWHQAHGGVFGPGAYRQDPTPLAAVDIALWDLAGKILDQPVYKLLGGFRNHIEVYASYDLWESVPDDQLARNASTFVRQGFTALKIRTGGSRSPMREARRLQAVREAVGPEVKIMYDALQYYNPGEAIRIGRALEPFDPYWFEDPVPEQNVDGCAQVADALDVPIASGEDTQFPAGYHLLMEKRAVDILMVDLFRVGGITPWRRIMAAAETRYIPVVSHGVSEISAHVLTAFSNGLILEYLPWSLNLYEEPPQVEDGIFSLPERPGFGLTLRDEFRNV